MKKLIIEGGKTLTGTIEISGAKKINKMLAVIPKVVAKVIQFFTDLNPFSKFRYNSG